MSDLPKDITGSRRLRLKLWLYADESKISSYNTAFASYLQDQLSSKSLWTATEVLDSGLAKPGSKQSFFPIQTILVADLASISKLPKLEEEVFNDIFNFLFSTMLTFKTYDAIGLDRDTTRVVFWSLFDVERPYNKKTARWSLVNPPKPLHHPAEHVSEVLNSLITVDKGKTEHTHENCGAEATVQCIRYQIDTHFSLLRHLRGYNNELSKENEPSEKINEKSQLIRDMLENLEALYRNFGGMTDLIDKLPDLSKTKGTGSRLRRIIRRLLILLTIRRRPIPYNPDAIKKRTLMDLEHLGRRTPVLSIYTHLHHAEHLHRLRAACAAAPEGAERSEVCKKFGLSQETLADPARRARRFKSNATEYLREHERVLIEFREFIGEYSRAIYKGRGPTYAVEGCLLEAKRLESIERELEKYEGGPERTWDSGSETCDEKLG